MRIDARWCLTEGSHDGVSVLTKTEAVGAVKLSDHHPGVLARLPLFSSPPSLPQKKYSLLELHYLFGVCASVPFRSLLQTYAPGGLMFVIFYSESGDFLK